MVLVQMIAGKTTSTHAKKPLGLILQLLQAEKYILFQQ